MARTQILVPQLRGPERGFRPCFADILNQKFSSVCGKARHVLVNGFFFHQSSWVSWKCGLASKSEAFALLNLKRSSLGLFSGQENRREKKVMAQSGPSVPFPPGRFVGHWSSRARPSYKLKKRYKLL